jgi:hypothetical protein
MSCVSIPSEEINDGRKRLQQAQAEKRESNGADPPHGDRPVPPAVQLGRIQGQVVAIEQIGQ